METRLSKYSAFSPDFPASWANYFHAGTSWLISLQILIERRDETGWGIFTVEPTIVVLCLELFTKAIAAYIDPDFNGHDYKHNTLKIIRAYKDTVPVFSTTVEDQELLLILTEYEREAIGLRYGEVGGNFDGDEKQRLIDLVYELRAEISKRTGLR